MTCAYKQCQGPKSYYLECPYLVIAFVAMATSSVQALRTVTINVSSASNLSWISFPRSPSVKKAGKDPEKEREKEERKKGRWREEREKMPKS